MRYSHHYPHFTADEVGPWPTTEAVSRKVRIQTCDSWQQRPSSSAVHAVPPVCRRGHLEYSPRSQA